KSPPEQPRTLMVQLSFVAFGLSAGGADLSCRIACAKMVTALLHDGSSLTSESSVNRADGNSEIEGKTATGSGERAGKKASFKSVVVFLYLCPFVPIHG